MTTKPDLDPIAELVRDLRERGKPSLAWVTRWSADGRDPVQSAWKASKDIRAMTALVSPRRAWGSVLVIHCHEPQPGLVNDSDLFGSNVRPMTLDEIRTHCTPPTLTDLLAIKRDRRSGGRDV